MICVASSNDAITTHHNNKTLTYYKTDTKQKKRQKERVRQVFFCLDLWSVLLLQTMQSPLTTTTKHLHTTKQTRNKKNDKKNVLDKSFSVSICDLCCFFKRCNHQSPQQQNTYCWISRNYTIRYIHHTTRYIKSATLKHSETDTKQKKTTKRTC